MDKELLLALRKLEISSTRLANEQRLAGNYKSVIKGQGLAFHEVRPYRDGDDVRRIDWNVSARLQEPFVKVFTEEREMTVMILMDISASSDFGSQRVQKRELAAEVAAICAFSAIAHGDRVGLIASSDQVELLVPPQKGRKHGMRVLREVLEFQPEHRGTKLEAGLSGLTHLVKRRSVSFLISDFFATGYERALSLAAARHDVIPVVLSDPRDTELPKLGLCQFEDPETGELLQLDTSSEKVRRAYRELRQEERREMVRIFRKLGLDYVSVETSQPSFPALRALFARRARKARR